ncbi:MAG TPA: glycosyl hydrolase [Bacteroidales bacterium]|nr:glycosyl hydrolase [Bacteroidales bacterium]
MKLILRNILFTSLLCTFIIGMNDAQDVPKEFVNPPREFSVMPFWFWNDTLKDEEIVRQIADFEEHGVYGFVIHPRIGLPDNVIWLSPEMIHAMNVAICEAARRKMYVILYDEGMYPSGSSSGQVVARNPDHAARGLSKIDLKTGDKLQLPENTKLITIINRPGGDRVAIIDQPTGGMIRGLHFIGEGTTQQKEETPPAADILNPDAVTSFMELVYDLYAREFGKYFGTTIMGIFTDEPSPLGRGAGKDIFPGNAKLLPQINTILGYDIKPFLADLWYNDHPESEKHRVDYNHAINICLEENYYKRLGTWCEEHDISLMGHPAGSMDIGSERYFQIPGQDLVWRYVEPGIKALEGQHSTMAKCASSSMIHLGLRRNSNELYGAYGHNLTFDEMKWLANWCFVRGQNFLIPHAFYYSIRGPRVDERPPDVGPNSSWWNYFKTFADCCRRLSWLNTDSRQVCEVAIPGESTFLPDKAAKICFQHQRDFNYLEIRHLWEDAKVNKDGVRISGMQYSSVILDTLSNIPEKAKPLLQLLADNGRLIIRKNSQYSTLFKGARVVSSPEEMVKAIDKLIPPDIILSPASESIRYRHIMKGGDHYYILFNEEEAAVNSNFKLSVNGKYQWLNPNSAEASPPSSDNNISFQAHELKVLWISGEK